LRLLTASDPFLCNAWLSWAHHREHSLCACLLQGMLRRGLQLEALKEFILRQASWVGVKGLFFISACLRSVRSSVVQFATGWMP